MTNQSLGIQQLPIQPLHTLHEPIFPVQANTLRKHADYSAPS
jgi:hypothetical protein